MTRYHPVLVVLHWLLALMIIGALVGGSFLLEPLANSDPGKVDVLRIHMTIGIAVLGLMIVRLVVRQTTAKPPHMTTGNALLDKIGVWTHWGFYLLVIGVGLSGMGTSLAAGLPDIVFGGSGAPLPASFDDLLPRQIHGALTSLLIALVALHIAAALYHQVIRKDGLMSRMGFGARK